MIELLGCCTSRWTAIPYLAGLRGQSWVDRRVSVHLTDCCCSIIRYFFKEIAAERPPLSPRKPWRPLSRPPRPEETAGWRNLPFFYRLPMAALRPGAHNIDTGQPCHADVPIVCASCRSWLVMPGAGCPLPDNRWCGYSDCPDGQSIERLYECEAHFGNPGEGFHSASRAADFLPIRDQALLNNACSAGWLVQLFQLS